jgi:hypothetical protein
MTRFWMISPLAALLALGVGGCKKYDDVSVLRTPMPYDNVYANPGYDHAHILNVLVLPLDNPMCDEEIERNNDQFMQSILSSFGKYNFFNVHNDPHFKETAGEIINLNTGFIDRAKLGEIGRIYNADAVIQIAITDYQPFEPMRMKVKGALIDTNTGERVWHFDHTFDGDDQAMVNALRCWYNQNMAGGDKTTKFDVSKIRPSVFQSFIFTSMAEAYEYTRLRNTIAIEEEKERRRQERQELEKIRKQTNR